MKRKILCLILCSILVTVFTIPTFASTAEDWSSDVLGTVKDYVNGDVTVIYTSDSTTASGIYYDVELDILNKQVLLVLDVDLPMGHVVYDDPATEYIDGIRLNGQTVTSYKIAIDYTQDINYEVVIKTVYAEDFTGTLAQISDGTFDWISLLENPVVLLIAAYYVLAIVFVVVGIISALRNKNKKVKTAEEIAKEVQTTAEAASIKTIEEHVIPVVTAFQNTAQALVKAFALTTSKSKEAPAALLDVLQNVSNLDATAVIEEAKKQISENRAKAEAEVNHTKEVLNNIANTVQEVLDSETQATEREEVSIF